MRGFRVLIVAVAFFGSALGVAERPNILLITSEDNGPELACYGDPFARTPNLDRLAAAGLRFDRAFVVTASCSESRAALLTGLFPHQNGQIGLATHHYRQFPDTPNVVRQLKDAGYRTGLIGKLHVNPEEDFPFDYRRGTTVANSYSDRDVEQVANAARTFFQAGDGPFFLMVNFADAHLPYLRQSHGQPEIPLNADEVLPLPWIGLDTPGLRQAQADYYNCIARLDVGIGHLLDDLDGTGHANNTLIIYLGDHGAQFPRGKLASYESSLRVPLLLCWPGRINAGQARQELISTLDIAQSIHEAAGIAPPQPLPGRSLLPLARGENLEWRTYLHTEYHGHYPPLYFPQRTVRDSRYKLIMNLLQDRPNPIAEAVSRQQEATQPTYVTEATVLAGGPEVQRAYDTWRNAPPLELYDLEVDPYEMNNLAEDPAMRETMTRLVNEVARWQKETGDPLADPEKLKKLTQEHDAIPSPYTRDPNFRWKYVEYLQP